MILKFRTGKQNINMFRDSYTGGETIEERKGMMKRGSELPLGRKSM